MRYDLKCFPAILKPNLPTSFNEVLKEATGTKKKTYKSSDFYFGGCQDWYESSWARNAGCASIAATNLAAYFGIGTRGDIRPKSPTQFPIYSMGKYLSLQKRLYAYFTPGFMGFPSATKFVNQFSKFAKDNKFLCTCEMYRNWENASIAYEYVKVSLREGLPLAMLTLTHSEPVIKNYTWHWMTIIGYTDEKIIFSNYGKRISLPWREIFKPGMYNKVTFIKVTPI